MMKLKYPTTKKSKIHVCKAILCLQCFHTKGTLIKHHRSGVFITDEAKRLRTLLRRFCPVDTGALLRSLSVRSRPGFIQVSMKFYGYIQNERGPHAGWIDDAIRMAGLTHEVRFRDLD